MLLDFYFKTSKLNDTLDSISKEFLLSYETVLLDRTDEIQTLIQEIRHTDENFIDIFACSLTGGNLENVLFILAGQCDEVLRIKIIRILKIRMNKTLLDLYWGIFQHNYTNLNILEVLGTVSHYVREYKNEELENHLINHLKILGDVQKQSLDVLLGEDVDLNEFLQKYGLIKESIFACKLFRLYFEQCEMKGFIENSSEFIDIIDYLNIIDTSILVERYLNSFDELQFPDDINSAIIEKYRLPDEKGELWLEIDNSVCSKFLRWFYIKEMKCHFDSNVKKFDLWKEFYKHIKNIIRHLENKYIFIDFGKFVIVDNQEEEDVSYLYDKNVFEREYKEYLKLEDSESKMIAFSLLYAVKGRDAVIEEINGDVLKLNYETAGKLYIKSIVKSKLRIRE